MLKKLLSLFLVITTLCTTVYAIPYDIYISGRNQYKTATYKISPGLTYTEMLSETEKYGIQRSYIYEYTPSSGTSILPLYGDYVYGRYSLGNIIEQLENDGKRVVGGVNGDFYIMSTGVSLSALIFDGEIITSDSGYTAMGFDKDGKAFISKPEMKFSLYDDITTFEIGHLNKTPNPYSLHLLTDKFASTTKSENSSTEIVLVPYTDIEIIETEEEYNDLINQLEQTDETEEDVEVEDDNSETEESPDNNFIIITKSQIEEFEQLSEISEETDEETETDVEFEEFLEETDEEAETDVESEEFLEETDVIEDTENLETTEETEVIAPEEIPAEVEELIVEPEPSAEYDFFAKKYILSDEKITVNSEIKTVITEIRKDSVNSSIPEGQFVLVADNTYFAETIKPMKLGSEYVLSVSAGEEWDNAVNAIGVYGGYILKDGEYCDDVEVDHYPYAHPRTAAGIKEDGTVIFYCVDGRQTSSGGMRIDELSHELKLLGCVEAVNLDGGGSTTAYAALPGAESSTIMNKPSGGTERKNANSLVFINTTEPANVAANYTFYPEKPYVVSGGSRYVLPFPSATDENYYPVPLSSELEYEYFVDSEVTDSYIMNKNEFVTGDISGDVDVYIRVKISEPEAEAEEYEEYKAGTVYVLDTVENFNLKYSNSENEEFNIGDEITLSPFDELVLTFDADYHTEEIFYDMGSFSVALPDENAYVETIITEETEDADISFEDEESDITDVRNDETVVSEQDISDEAVSANTEEISQETEEAEDTEETNEPEETENINYFKLLENRVLVCEKITLDSNLTVKPKIHGDSVTFIARLGAVEKSFEIIIEKFTFNDSFSHWSAKNLFDMNKLGLMQGEPDGEEFAFRPDRNLTKAEFFTVLARMLYPAIEDYEPKTSVTDIEETEGITEQEENIEVVSETFDDVEIISDEQVSVQEEILEEPKELSEQEIFEQMMLESATELQIFADYNDIPLWSLKYFEVLSQSGLLEIISRCDESGAIFIDPSVYITRREVLAVIGALCQEATTDFVSTFADTENILDDSLYTFINNAVSIGIFEGYEDGTLRPENNLTRAEAATVLLRFANISNEL